MEYYMMRNMSDDYLIHYGVKGMRWGVRKEYKPVGKSHSSNKSNSRRKFTSKQKKALGVVAGAAVLTAAGIVMCKTGAFKSFASIGKKAVKSNGITNDIVSNVSEGIKGRASSIAEKIKPINSRCNYNSFAAALSNKFNISLKPGGKYESNVTTFLNRALKNPDKHIFDTIPADTFTDESRLSKTIMRIAKNTEGASGQITSDLANGRGGHAFNWEVKDGNVRYFDTWAQTSPGKYEPIEDASHYIRNKRISGKNGKIIRLDNVLKEDLNMEYLKDKFIIH